MHEPKGTVVLKAFIRMNIFTSHRLCYKIAYSRSPSFLLKKFDDFLHFNHHYISINTMKIS